MTIGISVWAWNGDPDVIVHLAGLPAGATVHDDNTGDEVTLRPPDGYDLGLLWLIAQDDPEAAAYHAAAAPDFADFRVAKVRDHTPLRLQLPSHDGPIRFTPRGDTDFRYSKQTGLEGRRCAGVAVSSRQEAGKTMIRGD